MDTALLLILQVVLWPGVPALFTVEVTKPFHLAEFRGNVTMECIFLPGGGEESLSVFWRRILPEPPMEVYKLENGKEDLSSQDPQYRDRVRLLRDELRRGRAALQISHLRINDSGTYQCLVEMGGADYKQTILAVKASYKSINKSVRRSGRDEVELLCQSQGYPQASVVWTDGRGRNLTEEANTTTVISSDQLFHVTSGITVRTSNNTYTCAFIKEGLMSQSVTFHIPEEIPWKQTGKGSLVVAVVVLIAVTSAVCVISILIYRRRAGYKGRNTAGTMDCLIEKDPFPARMPPETNIEVQTSVEENEGAVENLREVLRRRYAMLSSDTEEAESHTSFCGKELPQRLRNRDGLPLGVTALLPDVGETILLEGEPGSGKTSVAVSLASAWAQNSERDPFGVKQIHLLILVTCQESTGSLFQEMMSQLSLGGEFTADALRDVLTGPAEALLVLDGYREGNDELDESLRRFLRERQTCRVLVTARPGQCGNMTEYLRTVLVLCRE
ncbi:uncharacterized protein si:ch211-241b2.5 [Megalops cyprinoides]|uniref:uncharacterized protein si:ch211-241b2.5 n=1 Tax=Megalops cyprinoides TaxID=118141 RepID=UPI0018640828|nr:uncharacterized protein si:ch211-241b2.5 [Megalops cyprinoides]